MLEAAVEFVLDILFPKRCVGCHKEGLFLCGQCRGQIQLLPPACFVCRQRSPDGTVCESCKPQTRIRRFIAPLSFHDQTSRELIHIYKYQGVKEIAEILGEYITSAARSYGIFPPDHSILVPIPLSPQRLRERGFNQAELVARVIGEKFGLPVNTGVLRRPLHRKHQTEMPNREERIENAKGVYAPKEKIPPGTVIILVDDVSTTGATLEEAARVLKAAGAKQVWALTAAR
ncbi:MAG: ComF family protein [Candidatus Sungbacteria bacterium]|uniref:ComF family protein n=1 Tax=Candidatus Sungiibacteriota bacterium TaxID=2750080 RepID=A0A931WPH9_9BACT|nr:ComF family protein [Candidatus Sungbacteria bacterium]